MSDFLSDIVVNKKTNYVYKEPISIELDCPDFKKTFKTSNYSFFGKSTAGWHSHGRMATIGKYVFFAKNIIQNKLKIY